MGINGPDQRGRERAVCGEKSRADKDGWNERRDKVMEIGEF